MFSNDSQRRMSVSFNSMPFDLIAENNDCSILTTYGWTIIFLFTSFTGLTPFFFFLLLRVSIVQISNVPRSVCLSFVVLTSRWLRARIGCDSHRSHKYRCGKWGLNQSPLLTITWECAAAVAATTTASSSRSSVSTFRINLSVDNAHARR